MVQKRCILCGRKFRHSYKLFGRTCLTKAYYMLDIEMPSSKETSDKELYLCNKIAKMNHKSLISKSNKYLLTELFFAKKYFEEIGLESTNRMAECVQEQIEDIGKTIKSQYDITMQKARNLAKIVTRFMIDYAKIKEKYSDDEFDEELFKRAYDASEELLNVFGDEFRTVFNELQVLLWQLAVKLGRTAGLKIAAETLEHSICVGGCMSEDIVLIEGVDGKYNELRDNVIEAIKKNEEFLEKIEYLVEKYTNDKRKKSKHDDIDHFIIDATHKEEMDSNDDSIYFVNNYDLMMAIHAGNINIIATKDKEVKNRKNKKYKLQIKIFDRYDFRDIKTRKDILIDNYKKAFGNIMNNFGHLSVKYGVLNEYQITIMFIYYI